MPPLPPVEILEELPSMRRYARALTRDDSMADDVVQEALLKALEKRHTFRPNGSRRGWLLAIVHNIFVSTRRQEAARARRDERFAETQADHLAPEQENAACLRDVSRAFAALPEHHREVLHLIAVEGQTYQEAAAILDTPVGTVMSRLSRARAALRQLQEDGVATHAQDKRGGLRVVGGRDDA